MTVYDVPPLVVLVAMAAHGVEAGVVDIVWLLPPQVQGVIGNVPLNTMLLGGHKPLDAV